MSLVLNFATLLNLASDPNILSTAEVREGVKCFRLWNDSPSNAALSEWNAVLARKEADDAAATAAERLVAVRAAEQKAQEEKEAAQAAQHQQLVDTAIQQQQQHTELQQQRVHASIQQLKLRMALLSVVGTVGYLALPPEHVSVCVMLCAVLALVELVSCVMTSSMSLMVVAVRLYVLSCHLTALLVDRVGVPMAEGVRRFGPALAQFKAEVVGVEGGVQMLAQAWTKAKASLL